MAVAVAATGAMPPSADSSAGLLNWHSFVLVFSYSVRPSGSCIVFHRGFRPPATVVVAAVAVVVVVVVVAAVAVVAAGVILFIRSVHKVIIIIATEAVAQFTMGEPVQKADDMLPLTSSAIFIRLPVGVIFWNASLNALSSATTTLILGVHVRLPLSPAPFW